MITVSIFEAIFFMIIILLFSRLKGLNDTLGSLTLDICAGFNYIALVTFCISLFCEAMRDTIEYIFENKSWKCYIVNILAIIAGCYMYFKYLYFLPGTAKLAGTVFILIYYAIYLGAIGVFYLIEDNTNADTASHTNILSGVLISSILVFFTILNIWNTGHIVTKAAIASDNNISYYIIEDKGVNIYDFTDGRVSILGGYRVTSKYTMFCKDMTVYTAFVGNCYTHKVNSSFTAIY